MTSAEYEQKLAELRSDIGELVERLHRELGPAAEMSAYPEEFIDWPAEAIADHQKVQPIGWILTVELYDPMEHRSSGFARSISAPMQSPGHSIGILRMGLDNYQPA